jgi:hypothetical protein
MQATANSGQREQHKLSRNCIVKNKNRWILNNWGQLKYSFLAKPTLRPTLSSKKDQYTLTSYHQGKVLLPQRSRVVLILVILGRWTRPPLNK